MTTDQMIERLCSYAGTTLAAKAKSKVTQFALGVASSGVGRRALGNALAPMSAHFEKPDGSVDVAALKDAVAAGFKASGSLPVLGGMISVDATDADEFFRTLEP